MTTDEIYDDLDELPAPPRKDIPPADRELLELAARALGARFEEVDGEGYGNLHFDDGRVVNAWNPLQFSGDALELAVRLHILVDPDGAQYAIATATGKRIGGLVDEPHNGDPLSATRRAVTRAAAEIGRNQT
jgi:hypothetical protein